MPIQDFDFFSPDSRRRIPEGYSRLVVARAKAMRTEFLRELWRQVRCWYQRRVALTQLRALDDSALKDIGLHRSGIEAALVNGAAGAAPPKRGAFAEKPHLCLQRMG